MSITEHVATAERMHNSVQSGRSINKSVQLFQSWSQQTVQKSAFVADTRQCWWLYRDSIFHSSRGLTPMMMQGSSPSQSFRHVHKQLSAGFLSIGAQGGTSNQSTDWYAGSDSSRANTAIQQQQSNQEEQCCWHNIWATTWLLWSLLRDNMFGMPWQHL